MTVIQHTLTFLSEVQCVMFCSTDEPRPPKLEVVLDPTGKDRED